MKKALRLLSGAVIFGVVLGACSSYDREEWVTELTEIPEVSDEQAICIVDELEQKLGTDRMGSRGSLTSEEEAIMSEVMIDCIFQ